jgi:HD superfamily phosphohydrolase
MEAIGRDAGSTAPSPEHRVGQWNLGVPLTEPEVSFTRLGALLHDIGHLAAGHTIEDELGLLPPHDEDKRLDLVFDQINWGGAQQKPTLRELIDQSYGDMAIASGLTDKGEPLSASRVLGLLISKSQLDFVPNPECTFRLDVCRDIIGNTICADLLDYLHRDWLHLGKRREFDTRLLSYMEIRTRPTAERNVSQLVINLRGGAKLRTDAVTAILDLLESRYQLAEIALFHRTKVCAAAMLERVIGELAAAHEDGQAEYVNGLPARLLELSDAEMLRFFDDELAQAEQGLRGVRRDRVAGARRLARGLRLRQIHKEFCAFGEYKLADSALAVQNVYAGPRGEQNAKERARIGASNRLAAVRILEADFGLSPGSIVMYCPPRKMNTKIAEVKILVHGDVHTLDAFESDHGDRGVTGGHLEAQKARFRRLWRVVFALEPTALQLLKEKGLLEFLGRAVEFCVLHIPHVGPIEESVLSLARELSRNKESPLYGKTVATTFPLAAQSDTTIFYPGGSPALLSCLER